MAVSTTIATTLILFLLFTSCVSFAFQPSTRYSPQSPAIIQQQYNRYTVISSSTLYSTIVDEIPSDATLDDDMTQIPLPPLTTREIQKRYYKVVTNS